MVAMNVSLTPRRCLPLGCAALLLQGAAQAGTVDVPLQAGGGYSVPATSLKEARQRRTIIQRFDFSCGSAAVATLLTHHYRFPVTEQTVFEAMFNSGDPEKIKVEGFSLLDMKRFLESHGFQADGFEATLEKLAEAGLPAIALINEQGYNHFVVVKGLRDGRVLIGDPASGTRALTQKSFEALWSKDAKHRELAPACCPQTDAAIVHALTHPYPRTRYYPSTASVALGDLFPASAAAVLIRLFSIHPSLDRVRDSILARFA